MSHNKRHSILPPISQSGPKAPVRFSSSITIAESAILTGVHAISVRGESLIHPRAKIESSYGPVDIGKRCIVHERTHIGAGQGDGTGSGITVGDYVAIQVGAVVETGGTVIKDGAVVGVGSRIGKGAVLGEWCTITPQTTIPPGTKVDDFTVVFSNGQRRRDKRDVKDLRKRLQYRQLEVQQKLIPSNPAKFG